MYLSCKELMSCSSGGQSAWCEACSEYFYFLEMPVSKQLIEWGFQRKKCFGKEYFFAQFVFPFASFRYQNAHHAHISHYRPLALYISSAATWNSIRSPVSLEHLVDDLKTQSIISWSFPSFIFQPDHCDQAAVDLFKSPWRSCYSSPVCRFG